MVNVMTTGMWVFKRINPFRTALQENWNYPVFLEVVHHVRNSCTSTSSVAWSGGPAEAHGGHSCQGPEGRTGAFRHRRCRLRQVPLQVDAMRLFWQRLDPAYYEQEMIRELRECNKKLKRIAYHTGWITFLLVLPFILALIAFLISLFLGAGIFLGNAGRR